MSLEMVKLKSQLDMRPIDIVRERSWLGTDSDIAGQGLRTKVSTDAERSNEKDVRDRPTKAVECDVEVDHDNGHIGSTIGLGVILADVAVSSNVEHGKRLTNASPDQQGFATILLHTEREYEGGHNNLDDTVDTGSKKTSLTALETKFLEDDRRVVVHRVDTSPLLPEHPNQ